MNRNVRKQRSINVYINRRDKIYEYDCTKYDFKQHFSLFRDNETRSKLSRVVMAFQFEIYVLVIEFRPYLILLHVVTNKQPDSAIFVLSE